MQRSMRAVVALLLVVPFAVAVSAPPNARAQSAEPTLENAFGLNEPVVGTDIAGLGGHYANNNQRNYWWNAARRRWDGFMPTASPPAASSSEWWLWHDLGGSPKSVALAETSKASSPDAYWDDGSKTLYAFFSRGNSGTSRFRRFSYDAATDRYVETSRKGGVAAPTMLRGGARVTIVKSPNGHLWAGVNYDNKLLVSRSTDGGDSWPDPVALKTTAAAGEGHWVLFTVGGATHVGFAATENGTAPGGQARVHFLHMDQNQPNWSAPASWTDETGILPAWEGGERADDELSAVVFENRVFVVIETEPLGDARSKARPQLIVYERRAQGGWLKHVIQRYSTTANDQKRPVITVDAASRLLVVTAGTTARTHAELWYAPIDALTDRDERWSKLRVFQVSDPVAEDIYDTRLPLPRDPVSAAADLLLMVDDRGVAQRMWRQVVRAASAPPPPAAPTVSISGPAGGSTLAGTVPVTATAANVVSVEFLAGQSSIGTDTDAGDGWSVDWNTRTVVNGEHTLTAVATNAAGTSVTSTPVNVGVDNAPDPVIPQTLDIPIDTSMGDVEERSNGRIWTSQSNLDLMTDVTSTGSDDQRAVGLRFAGVTIPPGATILDAYVQFQADKTTSVATALTITGDAADDAPEFTTVKYSITARPRTNASVAWQPPPWTKGSRTLAQRTAQLAPVVEEVVARPGWSSGNPLALIVEGTGERVAVSSDGLAAAAPVLHVEFRTP
ncbi:MAG TPA: Ig-like domain-containing protein [Euzebyales bacterium]